MTAYTKTAWANGGAPAISAANLAKLETASEYGLGVDTIAALRALDVPTSIERCWIRGHTAVDDGGSGVFDWDSVCADSDNDGTVVLPSGHSGAGRWVRNYSGAINVRWFGAQGDTITQETTFSAATHNGGVATDYPYEIHEKTSGTDDSAAFTAAFAALDDGMSLYIPPGTYFMTNTSNYGGNTAGSNWSFCNLTSKKNITIFGDGAGSKIFINQDIELYSLYVFIFHGCEDITVRDLQIDYQAVGYPDADTHPKSNGTKAQTRACLIDIKTYNDTTASERVKVLNCYFRLNHPAGAYPGASYIDGSTYPGSGKLIGISAYGFYAAPVPNEVGGLPTNAVVIEDCEVSECTFVETQARIIWGWMSNNLVVRNNKFLRECGGAKPCVRMLHYNNNLTVEGNYIECAGDWKDTTDPVHEPPITVSYNGGRYVNNNVSIINNKIQTQDGPGIQISGIRDSIIDNNTIWVDPDFTQVQTSFVYNGGIYAPKVSSATYLTSTDSSYRMGSVFNSQISNNRIKGKLLFLYTLANCTVNNNSVRSFPDSLTMPSQIASIESLTFSMNKSVDTGFLFAFSEYALSTAFGEFIEVKDCHVYNVASGNSFGHTAGGDLDKIIYDGCKVTDGDTGFRDTANTLFLDCLTEGCTNPTSDDVATEVVFGSYTHIQSSGI